MTAATAEVGQRERRQAPAQAIGAQAQKAHLRERIELGGNGAHQRIVVRVKRAQQCDKANFGRNRALKAIRRHNERAQVRKQTNFSGNGAGTSTRAEVIEIYSRNKMIRRIALDR